MRVAVFEQPGKRITKLRAYTLWYNPAWTGCCMHDIDETSGKIAKAAAMEEHRRICMKGRD